MLTARHRLAIATLSAAAVVAAGIVVLPSAGAAGGTLQGRFTLYNHDTSQASLDLSGPGSSVGDTYTFGGNVSRTKGGLPIGRMAGTCTTSSLTELLCTAAFSVPDGQVTFSGLVNTVPFYSGLPVAFAVTGGTGPYRDAHGTVTGRIYPLSPADAQFIVDMT